MNLDGFSLHPLALELNNALSGGRIDKITQPNKQTVIMAVRQPGKNYLVQLSINPQNPSVFLIDTAPENPPEPPTFCMVLRKHLETGRIASVCQYKLDRILSIEIDVIAGAGKITTKTLYIELMGKYSNIILTTDGMINDSLRKVGSNSSRVRTVLPGQEYVLPPQQDKLNPLTESPADLVKGISSRSEQQLTKAILDTCLGFGPVTAKEVAFSSGLPNDIPVSELADSDFNALETALSETIASIDIKNDNFRPSYVSDSNNKIIAVAAFQLHYLTDIKTDVKSINFATMSDLLTAVEKVSGSYIPPDKERFAKLINNELNRAKNKLSVLQAEAQEAENAEEYRIKGDNLMTYQYSLTDHADDEITVTDIYSEQGAMLTIPLDRRIPISQNCQNYYHKYNKLKRAQQLLKTQLAECAENILYLESIAESLKSSSTLNEINDIHNELIVSGYLREKLKKKPSDKASAPFEFVSPSGFKVLVGKNNLQNDRLTFKIASPNDLWLHTKDIPGSHVILRTNGASVSEADIIFAAETAAAFSKAANSSNVPVDCTACRYVKKPSGSKPGFVIFTNQKTYYVTPQNNIFH